MPGFGIGFNFGDNLSTPNPGSGGSGFPSWESDTVVDSVTYLFTSLEEIQMLFSSWGERQHTDDLNPNDENYDEGNQSSATRLAFLNELIQRATSHVMSYLGPRYTANAIYRIPRIREIATYWACYKLSRRRGNQPVYEYEYFEAMDDLEKYRAGELYLDAPSNGPRAIMQSYVVDNRFYTQPLRVLTQSSTSIVPGQRIAYRLPFYWL
jgi:hypothetical protein